MVKLQTSLLAVTLATGSALACSTGNEFQRRDLNDQPRLQFRFGLACARHNNLQPRGSIDEEDLFVRDDAFDDVEARAFSTKSAGELFSFGKKIFGGKHARGRISEAYHRGKRIGEHRNTKHALKAFDTATQVYDDAQSMNSRDLENNEDLEAREPGEGKFSAISDAFRFGKKLYEHKNTKHLMTAVDVGTQAYGAYQMVKSRDLEDDEGIFVRDLDAFDDLEAREPGEGKISAISDAFKFGKKLYEHKNTKHLMTAVDVGTQAYGAYQMVKSRDLGDDEGVFERDLDADEFFGREYDLFDERDTFDDLD